MDYYFFFTLGIPPNTHYFQGSHQVKHSCTLYCLPLLCFSDLITLVGLQNVFGDGHMLTNKYHIRELNRWPNLSFSLSCWKHLASCSASSNVLTFEIPLTHIFFRNTQVYRHNINISYTYCFPYMHMQRKSDDREAFEICLKNCFYSCLFYVLVLGAEQVCVSNSITLIPAHTPLSLPQLTHSSLQPFLHTFC